jgi:hypothetical protein
MSGGHFTHDRQTDATALWASCRPAPPLHEGIEYPLGIGRSNARPLVDALDEESVTHLAGTRGKQPDLATFRAEKDGIGKQIAECDPQFIGIQPNLISSTALDLNA